jgi:hypothetical protein
MTGFRLIESFDVDDGSLVGLSPQKCFVLGVEWEEFHRKLASGKPFTVVLHTENAKRLTALAERHKRYVEFHPREQCGFVEIVVGDLICLSPND